jgi:hypothetical protein
VGTIDSNKTYRIQGIPPQYEPHSVAPFLESLLGLEKDSCDRNLCSLAPSPVFPNEKVATLTTLKLDALLGLGDRWYYSIPEDGEEVVGGEGSLITGSRHIMIDTSFYGFTPLSAPAGEHEFEYEHFIGLGVYFSNCSSIIALTGLGSAHAFYSFKERNGNHMWLRDDLPFDFPQARIFTYGYDTKLVDSQSFQDLESIASTFRTALKAIRPDNVVSEATLTPNCFLSLYWSSKPSITPNI